MTSTNPNIISTSSTKLLTGDLAMWFFILAELTVFAILFMCYGIARVLNTSQFIDGQAHLHPTLGLTNTIALILSSFWLALAIHYYRINNTIYTRVTIVLSIVCAGVYLAIKLHEYQLLWQAGFSITTNTFFTLYFFITLFHYLHVIAGVMLMLYLFKLASRADVHTNLFESSGVYWHGVDIIWVILFPLLYVIR